MKRVVLTVMVNLPEPIADYTPDQIAEQTARALGHYYHNSPRTFLVQPMGRDTIARSPDRPRRR